MLCRRIDDRVESGAGEVAGLGLLDADIAFHPAKTLRRWQRPLAGYEIHHGRVSRCAEHSWFDSDAEPQGLVRGAVFGTHWHGLLDNDDFRRAWLVRGRGRPALRARRHRRRRAARRPTRSADLLAAHLDVDAVLGLLDGPPPRPRLATRLCR